jgi:hypothetical protein
VDGSDCDPDSALSQIEIPKKVGTLGLTIDTLEKRFAATKSSIAVIAGNGRSQ